LAESITPSAIFATATEDSALLATLLSTTTAARESGLDPIHTTLDAFDHARQDISTALKAFNAVRDDGVAAFKSTLNASDRLGEKVVGTTLSALSAAPYQGVATVSPTLNALARARDGSALADCAAARDERGDPFGIRTGLSALALAHAKGFASDFPMLSTFARTYDSSALAAFARDASVNNPAISTGLSALAAGRDNGFSSVMPTISAFAATYDGDGSALTAFAAARDASMNYTAIRTDFDELARVRDDEFAAINSAHTALACAHESSALTAFATARDASVSSPALSIGLSALARASDNRFAAIDPTPTVLTRTHKSSALDAFTAVRDDVAVGSGPTLSALSVARPTYNTAVVMGVSPFAAARNDGVAMVSATLGALAHARESAVALSGALSSFARVCDNVVGLNSILAQVHSDALASPSQRTIAAEMVRSLVSPPSAPETYPAATLHLQRTEGGWFVAERNSLAIPDISLSFAPQAPIQVIVNCHTKCASCDGPLLVKVERKQCVQASRVTVDVDVRVFSICPNCRQDGVDDMLHTVLTELAEGQPNLVLVAGGGQGDHQPRGQLHLVRSPRKG
jgi:hypothetical protein